MPKLKTHKGIKKRFKVSATGKVTHKKCGSSHLMSHKSGKQVRRLRKKVQLKVLAEARRIRKAVHIKPGANYTGSRRSARGSSPRKRPSPPSGRSTRGPCPPRLEAPEWPDSAWHRRGA